jgi:hypothetical protein
VKAFLNSDEGSTYKDEFGDAEAGTAEFSKIWKGIAKREPEAFKASQHSFIKHKAYDVMVGKIQGSLGIDINNRSKALQDVIWSTAVQHGGASSIVTTALKNQDISKLSDADIIKLIYAERGRKDANGNLVHFSSSSSAMQKGVANRFTKELNAALQMLGTN